MTSCSEPSANVASAVYETVSPGATRDGPIRRRDVGVGVRRRRRRGGRRGGRRGSRRSGLNWRVGDTGPSRRVATRDCQNGQGDDLVAHATQASVRRQDGAALARHVSQADRHGAENAPPSGLRTSAKELKRGCRTVATRPKPQRVLRKPWATRQRGARDVVSTFHPTCPTWLLTIGRILRVPWTML